MSRKPLDKDIVDRIDAFHEEYSSTGGREHYLARYQYVSDRSQFSKGLKEWWDRIRSDDALRQEYLVPLFTFFYEEQKRKHLEGDSMALMRCMHFCAKDKVALPEWAAEAFSAGFTKVENYEARGWDDVFGKPHKGKHIRDARPYRDKLTIYSSVRELIGRGCKKESAWAEVGKRFGSEGREVRDIYYEIEKQRVKGMEDLHKGAELAYSALESLGFFKHKRKSNK